MRASISVSPRPRNPSGHSEQGEEPHCRREEYAAQLAWYLRIVRSFAFAQDDIRMESPWGCPSMFRKARLGLTLSFERGAEILRARLYRLSPCKFPPRTIAFASSTS